MDMDIFIWNEIIKVYDDNYNDNDEHIFLLVIVSYRFPI